MRIICTVKEFGELVRGCAKRDCYHCIISEICGDADDEPRVEKFISAADIIEEPETGGVADG